MKYNNYLLLACLVCSLHANIFCMIPFIRPVGTIAIRNATSKIAPIVVGCLYVHACHYSSFREQIEWFKKTEVGNKVTQLVVRGQQAAVTVYKDSKNVITKAFSGEHQSHAHVIEPPSMNHPGNFAATNASQAGAGDSGSFSWRKTIVSSQVATHHHHHHHYPPTTMFDWLSRGNNRIIFLSGVTVGALGMYFIEKFKTPVYPLIKGHEVS